jgi:transposase-like protein
VDADLLEWYDVKEIRQMTTPRRSYSAEYKAKVALEALKGLRPLNELAAEHGIHPNQIGQWRTQLLAAAPGIFSERNVQREKAAEELQAQLYQQIGQLKVELDWLKKKLGPLA